MTFATFIKKTALIFLWSTVSIVALLLLLAAIIQIPSIQHFIIQRATVSVNNKLPGKVAFARAGITFRGSLFIDGLYIEDPAQDTLLYAGNVKAAINLFALISGTIHLHSVSMKNTFSIVSRTNSDSLFNYQFLLTAFADTAKTKTEKPPAAHVRIDNVNLDNVRFAYDDRYSGVSVIVAVQAMNLNMNTMDLQKLEFGINTLAIDGCTSSIAITRNPHPVPSTNVQPEVHVSANKLKLSNSLFAFDMTALPVKNGNFHDTATGIPIGFNPSHLHFTDILLRADNVAYSPTLTKAHITNFSARDSGRLYVSDFSTDFKMDEHGISASKSVLRTSVSDINCSVALKFASLESFVSFPDKVQVDATINHATIGVSDILYLVPQAASSSFLHGPYTSVTAAGTITGPLSELTGDRIEISVGNKTLLKTDCVIAGLPDVNKLRFTIPKLHLTTGRTDIAHLLGKSNLPPGIYLPESIDLEAHGKGTLKTFATSFKLTTDYGTISARGSMDADGVYDGTIQVTDFNAGLLLNDTAMFGPVDAQVDFTGKGLDQNTVNVKVKADASTIYLNRYPYKKLLVDGTITGTRYDGKISVNDPHAAVDFDGLIDVAAGNERYNFTLNIDKADVQPLNIFGDDIRVAAKIVVDARGKGLDSLTGSAALSRIVVVHKGTEYQLDSLAGRSVIAGGERRITVISDLMDVQYTGTVAPSGVAGEVKKFVTRYFSLKKPDNPSPVHQAPGNFNFAVQVHQHPLLSGFLLPQLTGFSPCSASVRFTSGNDRFLLSAAFPKIAYSGTSVSDAAVAIDADDHRLDCRVTTRRISNGPLALDNFSAKGSLQKQEASLVLSAIDDNGSKNIFVKIKGALRDNVYRISIDPSSVHLGNRQWTISPDNFMGVENSVVTLHNLSLSSPSGQISVSSSNDSGVEAVKIGIVNLDLNDLSRNLVSDTAFIKGLLNA
ncbi:MAG: hypothetical protein JW863_18195, partial [Chitinispirillaceae bacterium]|nr:hypothetical protein [Chitinispirillaceae bacterium]